MLLKIVADSPETPVTSIHINPDFEKANTSSVIATHINPNFLFPRPSPCIHLNPHFLAKTHMEKQTILQSKPPELHQPQLQQQQQLMMPSNPISECKLIKKSSMRVIRVQTRRALNATPQLASGTNALPSNAKISMQPPNTKVVYLNGYNCNFAVAASASASASVSASVSAAIASTSTTVLAPATTRSNDRYKIDRRKCRIHLSKMMTKRQPRILHTLTHNKKLQVLNINGLMYKSTRNKLQRRDIVQDAKEVYAKRTPNAECVLAIRGVRFALNKQGLKLTRLSSGTTMGDDTPCTERSNSFKRIDLGGHTYLAKSPNIFIRTGYQATRSYVHNAKQRSLLVLTRSLNKCNMPCAIYQRLGRCAAYEHGHCRKVHDPRQISICPRFLRDDCSNVKCLLSHQVSLSKMPVCKFYLQGICVRSECPYLHKKVNPDTPLCPEFLRGFCKLADECEQRHEFLCADYERPNQILRYRIGHKILGYSMNKKTPHENKAKAAKSHCADDKTAEAQKPRKRYFDFDAATTERHLHNVDHNRSSSKAEAANSNDDDDDDAENDVAVEVNNENKDEAVSDKEEYRNADDDDDDDNAADVDDDDDNDDDDQDQRSVAAIELLKPNDPFVKSLPHFIPI